MKEFGKDYSEDIKINRYDLISDVEMQPSMVQYYAELEYKADDEVEKAKAKLKLLEAEKYLYYKGKGGTDVATNNAVVADPEVIAARDAWLKACENLSVWKAAHDGARAKTEMLKLATSQLIGGFYSSGVNRKSDKDAV